MPIDDKLKKVRSKMAEYQVNVLIVHRTDDVACKSTHHCQRQRVSRSSLGLFNLRGGDIPFNPVFLSFAIVTADSVK